MNETVTLIGGDSLCRQSEPAFNAKGTRGLAGDACTRSLCPCYDIDDHCASTIGDCQELAVSGFGNTRYVGPYVLVIRQNLRILDVLAFRTDS